MKILNLTQHPASQEQLAAGVIDPGPTDKARIVALLTIKDLPTAHDLYLRAASLTAIAREYGPAAVMIGGAPFLMTHLERFLGINALNPVYAFSKRVVEESLDGKKISVFRHEGFVPGYACRIGLLKGLPNTTPF